MKNTQILIVAYYYPPIKSMGVIRNYFLSNELARQGHDVQVITTDNRNILPSEILEINKSISVQSIFTFDYRTILNFFRKKESTHLSVSSKNNFLGRFFVKTLRSFPFNLLIGEGGFFYCVKAIREGVKLINNSDKQTILYSSFPTYSDHFVASVLRKKFPNKTKWIADFRDLHTDPLYKIVYLERLQHWCNKYFLKRADVVTTISKGLAIQLKRYHSNVHVFFNGVNLRTNKSRLLNAKFTISYTGSLFSDERNPSLLFQAIKNLLEKKLIQSEEISFSYAGKDSEMMQNWIDQIGVNSIFIDYGLVSREMAHFYQNNANVNLLLTSSHKQMSGVLTGKLFEYLSTENPILLIINGEYDEEFENIFTQLNAGYISYNKVEELEQLENYVLQSYLKWKTSGYVKNELNKEVLMKNYSWENNIKSLLKQAI